MPDGTRKPSLHDLMKPHCGKLARGIVEQLRHSSAEHYRHLDENVLEARARDLVDAFLASLVESPSVFIRHITMVARERIVEGFHLVEIQTALRILEELTWKQVVSDALPAEQVRHLCLATGIIGAAKDQMAQIFLEQFETAETRVLHLQRKVDEIARGTDPGTVMMDDDDQP